jgi:hypothetical protein
VVIGSGLSRLTQPQQQELSSRRQSVTIADDITGLEWAAVGWCVRGWFESCLDQWIKAVSERRAVQSYRRLGWRLENKHGFFSSCRLLARAVTLEVTVEVGNYYSCDSRLNVR